MACGTALVKYILFFFNFIFVVGGAALIVVGALTYTEQTKYVEFVDLGKYQGPPIAMMVFGSIMFVIAFMGCCGALRESNCMIMTYSFLLFVILVVEIGVAVSVIYYKDDFEKVVNDGFDKSMNKYKEGDEVAVEAWDALQQNLKCCGADKYQDWVSLQPVALSVPDSCCINKSPNCAIGVGVMPEPLAKQFIYTEGCIKKALEKLGTENIIYAGMILAAAEIIGVIFACCLGARFRNKNYRNNF